MMTSNWQYFKQSRGQEAYTWAPDLARECVLVRLTEGNKGGGAHRAAKLHSLDSVSRQWFPIVALPGNAPRNLLEMHIPRPPRALLNQKHWRQVSNAYWNAPHNSSNAPSSLTKAAYGIQALAFK